MTFRQEIKEAIQGWWGDPDDIESEIDDIVEVVEKLINEKIKDNLSKGEQMTDATYDPRFKMIAESIRLTLEDLKEELRK